MRYGGYLLGLLFSSTMLMAVPTTQPSSTVKCPSGYVCQKIDVAADVDVRLIELARDLKQAKAKVRRLGGVLGCGVGVGFQVEEGEVTLDGMPFCGAVFGIRF